jgi:4-hydroxybenzoyl-CoA reductase subunit beta
VLRLSPFHLKIPKTLDEAIDLLDNGNARILAGGTDLVPNLKHRIYGDVPQLVSLRKIPSLNRIELNEKELVIGAGVTLSEIAQSEQVRQCYPALALAAANVASPQIRNMATLGGNLCLDTRCTYINQSEFWRGALGGCLKADGDLCHVVPGGKNCVAAFSGDMAIALIALETTVDTVGQAGKRTISLPELYNAKGAYHLNLQRGEILTRVHIPRVPNRRLSYRKWSVRQSIDFPLVNVAIRVDEKPDGEIEDLVAVVGLLAARPKVLSSLRRCVVARD